MVVRELPPAEDHRLAGLDIAVALPHVRREDLRILVVEDDGQIIGTWAVQTIRHLEGVWIDPAHRGRGRVAKLLCDATLRVARETSPTFILTAATSPDVARLITRHLGGLKLPADTYVVPTHRQGGA